MHMWWPFLDVWLRWWRCVFSPPFLHRPDSQPPGMIINLIIKHLLPTAPALSRSSETLRTPPQRERARERRRAGEGGRDTGGARGRGWREESNSKGSSSHCWILLHQREAVVLYGGRQHVKLFDPRTKETRRKEQSDAGRDSQRGAPDSVWHLQAINLLIVWLLFTHFHFLFKISLLFFFKMFGNVWFNLRWKEHLFSSS